MGQRLIYAQWLTYADDLEIGRYDRLCRTCRAHVHVGAYIYRVQIQPSRECCDVLLFWTTLIYIWIGSCFNIFISLMFCCVFFFPQVATSIIDYTCNVDELKGVPREKVAATLAEVGFDEKGQAAPITSLSGGWKMKLALARAMLQEAQVRLLTLLP